VKFLKRIFLGLIFLAALLIGGVFLAVNLIDPNDYKDKIQSLAMEKTGRTLSIDGDIGLSYFPWAGLTLGSIAMDNPEEFGKTPFARIESANVKVEILPLLKKSVIVDTVELKGLQLDLQRAEDGTTNWDDLIADNTGEQADPATQDASNQQSAEPGDASSTGSSLTDLSIGSVVIENAQIKWTDRQNNTDATLSGFNLETDAIALAAPFNLNTDFAVQSNSSGIEANVTGDGEITIDLDNQEYTINQLTLSTAASGKAVPVPDFKLVLSGDVIANLASKTASISGLTVDTTGVRLSGDLQLTDFDTNPQIRSALKSNTFSPRAIAEKLEIELPAMHDSDAMTAASVALNLSGSAQNLTVNDLAIKLDDTTFSGNAKLPDLTRAVPPVQFDFNVDEIDLDRYLPPTNENPDARADTTSAGTNTGAGGEAPATGDAPLNLPIELLRQLDIAGIFRIGKFKASNLTTENISIPVSAANGTISLNDIKASMYNGDMSSSMTINVTNAAPRFQFATTVNRVQAEPLLQDLLQDNAPLSGEAIVSAEIVTTGDTINQLKRNLNGQFVSDFTDGAINGINIGYQLRRARSFFTNAADTAAEPVSKTDFSALHVSATITDGVIQSDDLDIRAPALRISGAGMVDLPQERVDYTVNPNVVGSVEGQGGKDLDDLKGVAVSVPVRGTFEELSRDFTGTVFAAMKKDFSSRAEDAAKALAKKERDRLKAEAREKADAAKREAEQKLRAERARAEEKAKQKLAEQKEKVDQAAEEIKQQATDKLKSLFK
jgi:AsmA protein